MSYCFSPESSAPADRSLREVMKLADRALGAISAEVDKLRALSKAEKLLQKTGEFAEKINGTLTEWRPAFRQFAGLCLRNREVWPNPEGSARRRPQHAPCRHR